MKVNRKKTHVFLEEDLVIESREMSKEYPHLPVIRKAGGSASWYVRQAVMEKLKRDGIALSALELNDFTISKRGM